MSRHVYVYYRVSPQHLAAAQDGVRSLQRRWRELLPALRCELLRRSEPEANEVTLMETYVCDAGISPHWRERIERETHELLAPWLIGRRHVEVFEPCA
jgi:hypothetical protein